MKGRMDPFGNWTNRSLSSSEAPERDIKRQIYHSFLIAEAFFIVLLNGYVLSLFVRQKYIYSTSANTPLLSVVIADLQAGIINIPLLIAADTAYKVKNKSALAITATAQASTIFSAATSMSSLFIAVGVRYLSFCHPLVYIRVVARKQIIKTAIVFAWVLSFVYALSRFIWMIPVLEGVDIKRFHNFEKYYFLVSISLYLILALCFVLFFTSMLNQVNQVSKPAKSGQRRRTRSDSLFASSSVRKRDTKIILVFVGMFVIFLISWTPLVTLRSMSVIEVFGTITVPYVLIRALMACRFLTSFANPILYTLHKTDFFKTIIEEVDFVSSEKRRTRSHLSQDTVLFSQSSCQERDTVFFSQSSSQERDNFDDRASASSC